MLWGNTAYRVKLSGEGFVALFEEKLNQLV